jgi:Second Messenger Oligonucleotide or Dinucleotide Synthetase domain
MLYFACYLSHTLVNFSGIMQMGLADWFNDFCANLQVRDGGSISTRYKNITRRPNTDFWNTTSDTAHSLYVGSYGRNTAIGGFSDLDMIMQLPYSVYEQYNGHAGNGQSALLQAVKTSVERTYPTTSIKADGQVIVIPFTDGISFELVPAFINKDDSYTHPDANSGGRWRVTNPRPEIKAIRDRNDACNGNLVPLCRMARAWKRTWDVPIGGLLIDTLAYQFIESWQYRDKSYLYYDYMSRDFFKWMADQNEQQEHWKAPGSGTYVYGKGLFQYKAKRCYNISLEVIEHETAATKREWSAKQKWREIFGTSFPN